MIHWIRPFKNAMLHWIPNSYTCTLHLGMIRQIANFVIVYFCVNNIGNFNT